MFRKLPPSRSSLPGCAPQTELPLSLRPHPLVPVLMAFGLGLLLLLSVLLLRERRFAVAAGGALATALLGRAAWQAWSGAGPHPVALLLGPGRQLALRFADGSHAPMRLGGGSLFIGKGALLVLRGPPDRRLWLGPANLAPAELAALRRWLSRARATPRGLGRNFLY